MSATIYLLTLCLPLGTVLIVFGMRYASAVMQARAHHDADQAYRQVAEKAAAAQAETAQALAGIQDALADARARLASVEAILKAVE